MLKKVLLWGSLFTINQIYNSSGSLLLCLNNLTKIDRRQRGALVSLILKIAKSKLCLPARLCIKLGLHFLLFLTKTIHTYSEKALKYLQQTDQPTNNKTNIKRTCSHPNLYFYLNKIPFQPTGEYIDDILLKWNGNYELLLSQHSYIQWLFPTKETSSNDYSFPLTDYEARQIKKTSEAKTRVLMAFQMMLDFWGMELTPHNQFKDSIRCHQRWELLNSNPFLGAYITRILKMFKELDLHYLNSTWLIYLSDLIFKRNELSNLKSTFVNQWLNILPDKERKIIVSLHMS